MRAENSGYGMAGCGASDGNRLEIPRASGNKARMNVDADLDALKLAAAHIDFADPEAVARLFELCSSQRTFRVATVRALL
ncbi:MAG: hypothetical protein NTW87_09750 [Planctomycetota bacterium]|nr:hypothetical protein [Planctomycetota bacterium]